MSKHDPASAEAPDLSIAGKSASMLAPALEVDVTTAAGNRWSASIFGGRTGLTQSANSPNSSTLLCVAGGIPYLILVEKPDRYEVLPIRPVREIIPVIDAKLMILVGYTSLLAVGVDGVKWASPRLVSDGFSEVRVALSRVVVRGVSARDNMEIEITLDLATGEAV